MAEQLHQLRRAATQLAIRQAIAATAVLPVGLQRLAVRSLIAVAGGTPMLRRRVRENMRLALGHDPPARAESLYFSHLGWLLSSSLATFHRGVASTPVPDEIAFDDSMSVFDDAIAEGRGAILTSAHWTGHELVAAMINRRHPLTMLVRQAPTAERTDRKLKWYSALGTEIVLRPSRASTIKDAAAYLHVLKRGKALAITPDLLAGPGTGVETRMFGRRAQLPGGAFALALAAKAPMLRLSFRWQAPSRVVCMFDRAPLAYAGSDRDAAIRAGVADWCCWFEGKLRENPDHWLFWLDKRWSRFLRAAPPASGSE
jgi:lauroyl/myristoyl acyltransferase